MAQLKYDSEQSLRLDVYLSNLYPEVSRSLMSKHIDNGKITVNKNIAKPSLKLKKGDLMDIEELAIKPAAPKTIELPVIYEDDFCIVLDKPYGIITHAKGALSDESSVATFISSRISEDMTGNRAGIVHRLDRATSGVMIAAKTPEAMVYIQRQFAKRQTKKTYLAIVSGKLEREEAVINMPIERNPKQPSTFKVGPNGKSAETHFQVLAENSEYTLLKLTPRTGRTHQLRVHLKAIGHPIVGDILYGGEAAERMMLHAYELEVILPDQGRRAFLSPMPEIFNTYVDYKGKI